MDTLVCTYCDLTFAKPVNLKKHTLTSKKCLRIQGKEVIKSESFKCYGCNSIFSSKQRLKTHYTKCDNIKKTKLKNQIKKVLDTATSKKWFVITDPDTNKITFMLGSHIDSKDKHGNTGIFKASLNNDVNLVKDFLDHCADPYICNNDGENAHTVGSDEIKELIQPIFK